jgi:hypothetical protein
VDPNPDSPVYLNASHDPIFAITFEAVLRIRDPMLFDAWIRIRDEKIPIRDPG